MKPAFPASLASVFVPPPGYVGEFGWVCGFSGDAEFFDLAADRFSGQSRGQRAYSGRILLGVMLDPFTPQIGSGGAPGVLHLGAIDTLPWALLHAKVALLSFGAPAGDKWCIRLVVSTGNWTRQTLEESLDLVWTLDLGSSEAKSPDSAQAVADVRAAADLLREVRERFDTTALTLPDTPSRAAVRALDARIGELAHSSKNDPAARFFDNRGESLVRALTTRVVRTAGGRPRNRLVIGSGFYGSGTGPVLPVAAEAVVKALRATDLLTKDPEITLVVNPTSCQEVASAGPALKKAHWRVVASADPAGPKRGLRTLHAKFIFSANDRSAGNATSPWVYLGSGNLTAAGFLHRAGNAGNLEAGVVLALETLAWNSLCRRLPVEKDSADLTLKPGGLLAGESAPPRLPEYFAPPVAFLELLEEPPRLKLPTGSGSLGNFEILSLNGQPIMVAVDGTYRWDAPPPSEVRVRWSPAGSPRTAVVPVLDRFGRLAGKPLPALDFIDLEEELRSFPNPPEDDDEEQDPGESDDGGEGAGSAGAGGAVPSNYPFREMMQAIETIAARQTMVPEAQWPAWCARLEQALVRMKASPPVASVHRLGVNPLSVLRRSEFRPDYAGSPGSCQLYEDALTRVEAAWDYSGLVPLGGTS